MDSKVLILFSVVLLASIFIVGPELTGFAGGGKEPNLIQNPGFENDFSNWDFYYDSSNTNLGINITNKESFSGNKSVNFTRSIKDIDMGYLFQYVTLPKNRYYNLIFRYKPFNLTLNYPNVEGNTFFLEILNNFLDLTDFGIQCKLNESSYECIDTNQNKINETLNVNVSNGWNEFVVYFNTTGFNPNRFVVTFTLINNGPTNNNSYVLLDDVELYRIKP